MVGAGRETLRSRELTRVLKRHSVRCRHSPAKHSDYKVTGPDVEAFRRATAAVKLPWHRLVDREATAGKPTTRLLSAEAPCFLPRYGEMTFCHFGLV